MADYKKAVLVYLDVLGFGDLVRQSEDDQARVDRIRDILQMLQSHSRYQVVIRVMGVWPPEKGVIAHTFFADNFSDTLIRTTFTDSDHLLGYADCEIEAIAQIQAELACKYSILVRGGISVGKIWRNEQDKSDRLIFGPALLRSYELAEHLAVFPRILIDSELIALLIQTKSGSPASSWCRRHAEDGLYFVDYLNFMLRNELDISTRPAEENLVRLHWGLSEKGTELLADHIRLAERKLSELGAKGDHLRQKALWLALYHNRVIEALAKEQPDYADFEQFIISDEKLRS